MRTLHEGFVDDDLKLCVFTDHQIFDRFHKYNLKSDRARSGKLALSLKELNQIEKGDYIVHEDLGVGKFGGLIRTSMNGTPQEMIKLTYLNGDEAYVSIHSLHKLSKYRSKEGEAPRLNRLGSNAWAKSSRAPRAASRTSRANSSACMPPAASNRALPTRPTATCSRSWRPRSSTRTRPTS